MAAQRKHKNAGGPREPEIKNRKARRDYEILDRGTSSVPHRTDALVAGDFNGDGFEDLAGLGVSFTYFIFTYKGSANGLVRGPYQWADERVVKLGATD